MADTEKFFNAIRKIFLQEIKKLGVPYTPIKAEILNSYIENWKCFADLKPLKIDGSYDEKVPILYKVESPVTSIGSIVRVNFYYWDISQPYIEKVIKNG